MSSEFKPENPFRKDENRSVSLSRNSEIKGLKVERFFSSDGVHPFDQLQWEKRSAKISDDTGAAIFEQNDIEVPLDWSQLATKVVSSKYFYGDVDSGQREHSVKQLVH